MGEIMNPPLTITVVTVIPVCASATVRSSMFCKKIIRD